VVAPFTDFVHTSFHDMAWLWLYGVLNIGIGFGLYLLGVRKIKAMLASLICMLEIALAPLWAFLVFADPVRESSLIGGLIILVAATANLLQQRR
jgi:drug/metabolite transporter (DMT)-like permease